MFIERRLDVQCTVKKFMLAACKWGEKIKVFNYNFHSLWNIRQPQVSCLL